MDALAFFPKLCQEHTCYGWQHSCGHGHRGDGNLDTLSVPSPLLQAAMGIAALDLLWTALLLPLLVSGVPTEEHTSGDAVASGAPGRCRRCCDSGDPLVPAYAADESSASPSSLPYVWPEVRPYINMTILKGECLSVAQAGLARSGTWRALAGGEGGLSSWAWGVGGGGRSRRNQDRKRFPTLSPTHELRHLLCVRTLLSSGAGA